MNNDTKIYKELTLLGKAFMVLNEDERTVLLNRFGFLGRVETFRGLAEAMIISPERVRQKQERALDKLNIAYDTLTKDI